MFKNKKIIIIDFKHKTIIFSTRDFFRLILL